jgi:hypothetical protein
MEANMTAFKRKAHPGARRSLRAVLLVLVLVLAATVATSAQGGDEVLTDEELWSRLSPVILKEEQVGDAQTFTVEIPVRQDTYVASKFPNTNYGQATSLRTGFNASGWSPAGAQRTFYQFDISSIPSGATIDRADLRFYQYLVSPAGASSMEITSRHLNQSWNESTVTWNQNQPNWGPIFNQTQISSALGWHAADVTGLVRGWYDSSIPNNGVLAQGDERQNENWRAFYSLNANNGRHPRLVVTYTKQVDNTPPTSSVQSLPQWSPSKFVVTWSGKDNEGGSGIDYYDVQYNENGGSWIDGKMKTRDTSGQVTGAQNGVLYGFRCRAVDKAGNKQAWSGVQAQTRVDTIPPTATVNPLPEFTPNRSFTVSWGGNDNPGGSGLARYDVQWRQQGGEWVDFRTNTNGTSAQFTDANSGWTYEFRARGIDHAGNKQAWGGEQAQTTVVLHPVGLVNAFTPPFVEKGDPITDRFTVTWKGFFAPGTQIVNYEIWVRFRGGAWTQWTATSQTSAVYTIPSGNGDGAYEFEAVATNNLGQKEPRTGKPEAFMYVDLEAPFMEVRSLFPLVQGGE